MMLEHRIPGLTHAAPTCVGCVSSSQDVDMAVIKEVVAKEQTDKTRAAAAL